MRWLVAIVLTGACAAAQAPTPSGPIDLMVPARDATLAGTLQFPTTGRAPYPAIVLAHRASNPGCASTACFRAAADSGPGLRAALVVDGEGDPGLRQCLRLRLSQ